jgi:glutathione S-transferase
MLKIWGRATSSNVQKVTWLLDEIGLAHERIDIGGPFGGNREPSYRALNPNGLVPTLQDGDFTLWESNAICRYLANRESAHTLYPTDFQARADVERWMDWSTSMLGPALHAAFWGLIRTAPADRDLPAIRASAVKTGEALSIVDAQLADRPWVCGNRFTLADIALGIHSYRFLNLPWPLADATPVVLPNLLRWYARLGERPAYRRVVMIPIV